MPSDVAAAPTVSVVVRTRNRPTLLIDALRDIESQTFTDIEVVLVDDGDEAHAVDAAIAAVPGLAARIRVIDRTGEAHGRARAANAGLQAARGEFLVLHDDDDSWEPDFLAVAVEYLRTHPEARGVSAHTEVVVHRTDPATGEERLERLLLNPSMAAISIPDMVRENRVTTHSLLYRSVVHHEIGYLDETLIAHEDWDFYLRFIARYPIELLPLPARAYWHHRPEATGDDGNSVFVLDSAHDAGRMRVRDNYLRASVAQIGLGPALHLAAETQALEAELQSQREALEDLRARMKQLESELAGVPGALQHLQASIDQIPPLVLERTSLSSLLRRARRKSRR